jgi:hypothetical protein
MATTTTVRTAEDLAALLQTLGESPAAVADSLLAAGITGKRDDPECCPVANWLRRETGAEPYVEVDEAQLRGTRGAEAIEVKLPRAVRGFVEAFDFCEYLDLEADDNP